MFSLRKFLIAAALLVLTTSGASPRKTPGPGEVYGRIQFVTALPDVKVKVVTALPAPRIFNGLADKMHDPYPFGLSIRVFNYKVGPMENRFTPLKEQHRILRETMPAGISLRLYLRFPLAR